MDGVSVVADDCPVKVGMGVNLADEDTVFEIRFDRGEDRRKEGNVLPEVYGVFITPGAEDRDADLVQTDSIEVQPDTPVARLVDMVAGDETGELEKEVGLLLKTGAATCHCYFANYCPKLGAANLLAAMQTAVTNQKSRSLVRS